MKLVRNLILAAVTLTSINAFAYISEGVYYSRGHTYYVNGRGAYCETNEYHPDARRLSRREEDELYRMRFDGACEGFLKGAVNYRGRSYYSNGNGAYCEYPYYNRDAREMSDYEAEQMFRQRFDGTCRG